MTAHLPTAQRRGYTCGPTCLANALALYGLPVSQLEAQGACSAGKDGTDEDELQQGIRALGFRPRVRRITNRELFDEQLLWMRHQTKLGRMCICSINGHGREGHWILILGVNSTGSWIHIWDPSDKYSKMVSRNNLFQAWWNVPVPEPIKYKVADAWAVALVPATRTTERACTIRRNLMCPPSGKLPTKK